MSTTEITPLRPLPTDRPIGAPRSPGAGPPDADATITVHFGRARPTDVDAVHAFYEQLAPESRRRRFFQPMPRVPLSIARHLCSTDPRRHVVWLAHEGAPTGPVIGEIQVAVEPLDPTRAELALAVADRWAGRGLGRTLVDAAHDLAAERDVETLTAEVLHENRRCVELLLHSGMRFTVSSGVLTGTGAVDPSRRLTTSAAFPAHPAPTAASA